MTEPEFSRMIDARQADGRGVTLEAAPEERAALARRFGLIAVDRLAVVLTLRRGGGDTITADGWLDAAIVQSCAVSADDLRVTIAEPIALRFVRSAGDIGPDGDIEIDAEGGDEIEYDGHAFDLGEAVAQSLALAIDPFATGPGADAARRGAGLYPPGTGGAFAALAKLRDPR